MNNVVVGEDIILPRSPRSQNAHPSVAKTKNIYLAGRGRRPRRPIFEHNGSLKAPLEGSWRRRRLRGAFVTAKTSGHVDNVRVANYSSLPMANIGVQTPTGEMKIGVSSTVGICGGCRANPTLNYIRAYTRAYAWGAGEKRWRRVEAGVARWLCNLTSGAQEGRAKIGKIWRKCSKKRKMLFQM